MKSPVASTEAISVLVADSNRIQSQLLIGALRRHPEFHVSACRMEPSSILQAVSTRNPAVALLALSPRVDLAATLPTLRAFHQSHPAVAKILLVDAVDRELVVHAFRSGARGIFSLSDSSLRMLRKCLLRVADGQVWLNTDQLNFLLDLITEVPSLRVVNATGDSLLTPREEQVVALVAEGLNNREIALELQLSEHTVKKYIFRIFEKLGISTRVELVLYAVNNGHPRLAQWIGAASDEPNPSA